MMSSPIIFPVDADKPYSASATNIGTTERTPEKVRLRA